MAVLRIFLGNRIRAIRNAKGLTQQNLADLSGLDYRYIGAIERGERNFSINTLEKVLSALKISLNELAYSGVEQSERDSVRWEAIDQFIASTEGLAEEQIEILQRVNREVLRAFK
ncbi:helix-turn-helix domain-containing protein [Paenibacillus sp. MB22_1]|uniref:helix-turn-helix domain-containing protein n=1 Tax=unclassified Paenibacillus TaxID=185978 RepID=UPI0021A58303|nr:helix-turn-helix transcriptional regulator [Paenibacillus sp. p3-SID1389]MCT2194735.1 helix-turn-helix domain-containing protein [Paenibacillus sp. p3-SID1389]